MFEKNTNTILYTREKFSLEEELYTNYINMRKSLGKLENMKYSNEDEMLNSEEFKQGFIAGIKIMSSILIDL